MGGVRNLEEKKKKNHVVSSGQGGGTKGPSIIDKRGQETKCPYCDKVYTQNGRLKDHIATKHKDEAAEGGASAASSSGAGPSRAPSDAAAAGGKPDPTKQRGTLPPAPASKAGSGKGPAAAAAGAAAGGSGAGGRPGSAAGGGGGGGGGAITVPRAQAVAAPRAPGGMMDVGSAAGYYTHKSPKMHLLEWCQRDGRLKPRITHRTDKDGVATCKVVLPHAKKHEEDIVVFLDARWARIDPPTAPPSPGGAATEGGDQAAADAAEREQRAAVAALHQVAGDRNYHMLLPKQYLNMWKEMGQVATQRKEQAVQRQAVAASREKRDKERSARTIQRAGQHLIMSREKQALIQELIRRLGAGGARGTGAAGAGAGAGGGGAALHAAVLPALLAMGFSAAQVHMAVGAGAGMGSGGDPLPAHLQEERVLDWLLVNLATEQLPNQLTAGANLAHAISKRSHTARGGGEGATGLQAAAQKQVHLVSGLAEYGYPPSQCEVALAEAEGDTQAALALLFTRLTGTHLPATLAAGGGGDGGDDNREAWDEEQMVLEAIYGDDVVCDAPDSDAGGGSGSGGGHVVVKVPLPEGCQAAVEGAAGAQLTLHAWCGPPGTGPDHYPARAPLLAVSCAALAPASLRALTRQLAQHASTLLHGPMLHDLATYVTEAAEQLPAGQEEEGDDEDQGLADVDAQSEAFATEQEDDQDQEAEEAEEEEEGSVTSAWDDDVSEEGQEDEADATDMSSSVQESASVADLTLTGGEDGEGGEGDVGGGLVDDFEGLGLGDLGPDDPPESWEEEEAVAVQPVVAAAVAAAAAATVATPLPLPPVAKQQQQQPSQQQQQSQQQHRSQQQQPQDQGPILGQEPPGWRRGGPRMRPADMAAENTRLLSHQQQLSQSGVHAHLRQQRSRLPAAGMRSEVLAALGQHAVLVISGATGCGKSTQVPQFILEECISQGRGAATNIIVTQPRRISALGLAQRVAAERGEEVGESVGYSVRLDSKVSARTRVLFCTTGILLRRLLSDPLLSDVTHVVLDEVHERSIEIDLLLLLLRDVLAQRASSAPPRTTTPFPATPPHPRSAWCSCQPQLTPHSSPITCNNDSNR